MAASSPRCVQQTATSPTPLLTKSISPAALSPSPQLSLPSSFTSELHSSPLTAQKPHQHSSCLTSSTTSPSLQTPPPVHTPNPWVATLLKTKFYGSCPTHAGLRKNDLNLFCIYHAEKICQYCHQARHHHVETPCTILHVSRYMYHDVLLSKEAATLLDISDVQSYLNNGNRVVYIDRRAQPKSKLAPHAKSCVTCSRTLQDPYRFCSLFCRLQYANDPAAVESIPLPDASPLLHQVVKKVKRVAESHTAPNSPKRFDRHLRITPSTASSPNIPVISRISKAIRTRDVMSPLRLASVNKCRRKATPYRGTLPSPTALMLSCQVPYMFI